MILELEGEDKSLEEEETYSGHVMSHTFLSLSTFEYTSCENEAMVSCLQKSNRFFHHSKGILFVLTIGTIRTKQISQIMQQIDFALFVCLY